MEIKRKKVEGNNKLISVLKALQWLFLLESILMLLIFFDTILGTDMYNSMFYSKESHNMLSEINSILFLLMPFYLIINFIFLGGKRNLINYVSCISFLLYLYVIYDEIILKQSF